MNLTIANVAGISILILAVYVGVGYLLHLRKDTDVDYLVGWFGIAGFIVVLAILGLVGIQVSSSMRQHSIDCRTKALPAIISKTNLSAVDINTILSKVCQ